MANNLKFLEELRKSKLQVAPAIERKAPGQGFALCLRGEEAFGQKGQKTPEPGKHSNSRPGLAVKAR